MRLWHYDIIRFLPKGQLLAQWRELNSIFKKQDKHILINYIYAYDKEYLRTYSWEVIDEMRRRGYNISSLQNMHDYFGDKTFLECEDLHFAEHDNRYLLQCFYNLQEKYDRGQTDFSTAEYLELKNFVEGRRG